MRIDTVFNPWDDTKVRQLFLPDAGEYPKDAIVSCIDILMDAQMEPEGYKSIIEGGHTLNNYTKLDIIKLNDKCIYLISALTLALLSHPTKTWI
jgi:hypothetical protein